jgi:hypothetical protein
MGFWMLTFTENCDVVLQWVHWPSASISMPIRNQVVSYSIEPGSEGNTFVLEGLDMLERTLKHSGRQILRILMVSCPIVNITIYPPDMPFVKFAECFGFTFCSSNKLHLIYSGISQLDVSRMNLDIKVNTKNL